MTQNPASIAKPTRRTTPMSELGSIDIEDRAAREEALDTSRSILVQAPAGSGKTELLAMRFLKLLAEVEEPEQILAITFTKSAAAEMRHRVLKKLEGAKLLSESGTATQDEDPSELQIAIDALENSNRRGWRVLEQPQRLDIQTIDSLSLRIAHQMPLSTRPSGMLQPTENASPLYQKAARKTFERLSEEENDLNTALKGLLKLRDGRLTNCESLLAGMLATRDQWARAFPLSGGVDWESARARLEEPFQREIERVLGEVHAMLAVHHVVVQELFELANYACGNAEADFEIHLLAELRHLPLASAQFIEHWLCLCEFLLTKDGSGRRGYNVKHGFPPRDDGQKKRMKGLVEKLSEIPRLLSLLSEIRELPPLHYGEEQWQNLRHMFVALRQAVSELDLVFTEEGKVDFAELGHAAQQVLSDNTEDISSADHGQHIRHLLVDEFQDTSRRQHELIASLLYNWSAGDGRTFFLVGDPMQSIYMFRQAEVELFDLVRKHGFAAGKQRLPAKTLRLTTNFRSNAGLVNQLNGVFAIIFPYGAETGSAAVDFLPGVASNHEEPEGAFEVHPSFIAPQENATNTSSQPGKNPSPTETAVLQEGDEVLKIIRRHLPSIEEARINNEEFTVTVLARSRNHLIRIAAALRDEEIPFRAVEMERLGERQEILDLQSLTRALLHPMDRIAWLAVLRAPWCGLALRDLHLLCGTDERKSVGSAVSRQIEDHLPLLSDASRQRI